MCTRIREESTLICHFSASEREGGGVGGVSWPLINLMQMRLFEFYVLSCLCHIPAAAAALQPIRESTPLNHTSSYFIFSLFLFLLRFKLTIFISTAFILHYTNVDFSAR